jgi:hypothetical protein
MRQFNPKTPCGSKDWPFTTRLGLFDAHAVSWVPYAIHRSGERMIQSAKDTAAGPESLLRWDIRC